MSRFVLSLFFAVAGLALSAEEPYSLLYWMVEEDPSAGIAFEYARVAAVKDGTTQYLLLYDADRGQPMRSAEQAAIDGGYATPSAYGYMPGESDAWNGYEFFIELVMGEDDRVVATSEQTRPYSTLKQSIITSKGDSPTIWKESSFSAVPEPTSGLLMLLGVAALALRRKRILV